MRRLAPQLALIAALIFAGALSARTADLVDFSGSYTLKSAKGEPLDPGETWMLQITQSAADIKLVTTLAGHPSTEIFPLAGGPAKCANSDGTDATCSASWKGKTLTLETVYVAHPTENGPDVEKHTRERLDLSSNRKTLTIRTETKAPQFPALEMSEPTTEIYIRN